MTVRPRSVGTFLISRPDTSAKLSARPRMRSMSSRERSSTDSRCLRIRLLRVRGGAVRRVRTGHRTRDSHLVDAVELLDLYVHPLVAGSGQVLADVVWT